MLVLMVPPNLKAALSPGTRRSSTPGVIRRQLNGFTVSLRRTLHVHAVLLDGVLRADIGCGGWRDRGRRLRAAADR